MNLFFSASYTHGISHEVKQLEHASFGASCRNASREPSITIAKMLVLLIGATSAGCVGIEGTTFRAFGRLNDDSLLNGPAFGNPPVATNTQGTGVTSGPGGVGLNSNGYGTVQNIFSDNLETPMHPSTEVDLMGPVQENQIEIPPRMLYHPLNGLEPGQFLGNVVDTYRLDRMVFDTYQKTPRSENVWNSISDVLNSPTALANIGARYAVSQLRRLSPQEGTEMSDPLAKYMTPARWRPFGGDSAWHHLFLDARPRNIDADMDRCSAIIKAQIDLKGLFGGPCEKHYAGIAYDTEGFLVFSHALTF